MKNDNFIEKLEYFFKVPDYVSDKIKVLAEKVKGGYVLIETRPKWEGSIGPWTKSPIAKITLHKPSKSWHVYWCRASGKWNLYGVYKNFSTVLKIIEEDKNGCFWG